MCITVTEEDLCKKRDTKVGVALKNSGKVSTFNIEINFLPLSSVPLTGADFDLKYISESIFKILVPIM